MHIIFGSQQATELADKYTVLELDTIQFSNSGLTETAYCLVEAIPIPDLPRVNGMKTLHENLIANYQKRDWNYCTQAIEKLMGFWGCELNSFYTELQNRILKYQENDPGDTWTHIVQK